MINQEEFNDMEFIGFTLRELSKRRKEIINELLHDEEQSKSLVNGDEAILTELITNVNSRVNRDGMNHFFRKSYLVNEKACSLGIESSKKTLHQLNEMYQNKQFRENIMGIYCYLIDSYLASVRTL